MTVTVILELRFKPDEVAAGRELMGRALQDTRAFDGNVRTDVLVDEDDEAHWLIYEIWETVEHDEAYRAFRAGEGKLTQLPRCWPRPRPRPGTSPATCSSRRPISPRRRGGYSGSPVGAFEGGTQRERGGVADLSGDGGDGRLAGPQQIGGQRKPPTGEESDRRLAHLLGEPAGERCA